MIFVTKNRAKVESIKGKSSYWHCPGKTRTSQQVMAPCSADRAPLRENLPNMFDALMDGLFPLEDYRQCEGRDEDQRQTGERN